MKSSWLYAAMLIGSIVGLVVVLGSWPDSGTTMQLASSDEELQLAEGLVLTNQSLREEIERLDREIAALEQSPNGVRIEEMVASLNRLRILNGAVGVVGPGVELSVKGVIGAAELRDLVNELKSAGAEAIAVNGRRLTPWSSFYEGQSGVVMDGYPLGPKLVIEAIGNPVVLREVAERRGGLATALQADGATLEVALRPGQSEVRLPVSSDEREFRLARLP